MFVLHNRFGNEIEPEEGEPADLMESYECSVEGCDGVAMAFQVNSIRGASYRLRPVNVAALSQACFVGHECFIPILRFRRDAFILTADPRIVAAAQQLLKNKRGPVWMWWNERLVRYSLGSENDPNAYMKD